MEQNSSWMDLNLQKTVFITMDVDWLCDEALVYSIDLFRELEIEATVFVTHNTPVLDKFRKANFELGIHPNFNELLKAGNGKPAAETVRALKEYVPEAKSIRSHSLLSGSVLSSIFKEEGFTHETNVLIPYSSRINLLPYEAPKDLLQLPYNWGDYTYLVNPGEMNITEYLSIGGLKIMNFHPIHLFLNTDAVDLYNNAKMYTTQYEQLKKYVNQDGNGIRDFLVEFVRCAKEKEFIFSKIGDIPMQT